MLQQPKSREQLNGKPISPASSKKSFFMYPKLFANREAASETRGNGKRVPYYSTMYAFRTDNAAVFSDIIFLGSSSALGPTNHVEKSLRESTRATCQRIDLAANLIYRG